MFDPAYQRSLPLQIETLSREICGIYGNGEFVLYMLYPIISIGVNMAYRPLTYALDVTMIYLKVIRIVSLYISHIV